MFDSFGRHLRTTLLVERAELLRLGDLVKVGSEAIDLAGLKKAGIVPGNAERAKIILAGSVDKAFKISGIPATKGAKAAIEKAGGSVAAIEEKAHVRKLAAKPKQASAS